MGSRLAVRQDQLSSGKSVLVVEDEFLIRALLSDELREAGYHVIEACNAGEALVVLESLAPDLIISDVRMPGSLDGIGLLAAIRETSPTLPVIITSGHLEPSLAFAEGATQFVSKPFLLGLVVNMVAGYLGKRGD